MARPLVDMTVLITGASSGIGAALARELARRGARLAVVARRGDRLATLVQELGTTHRAIVADVAVATDCERAVGEAINHFGRLDTVVCNAGQGLFGEALAMTREQWEALFAVNLHGTIDILRAALPPMRRQEPRAGWRGQVMIVSSILGRRGAPRCAAYCATKAAQLSLAEALRLECRVDRIAVTSVHPVGTSTEFFTEADRRSGAGERRRSSALDQSPQHVARRMAAAIVRPRPEVWPSRISRWVASWATFAPSWADALVARLAKDG